MKLIYGISSFIILASALPAFGFAVPEAKKAYQEADSSRENPTTVAEFTSSGEHVGMSYCKECGKYIFNGGSIADEKPILPAGVPANSAGGAAKAKGAN